MTTTILSILWLILAYSLGVTAYLALRYLVRNRDAVPDEPPDYDDGRYTDGIG